MPLFKSGDRLADRFTVEALVASGGMGDVYRAVDSRLANRHVALKVLRTRPGDTSSDTHAILLTEIRSLSRLNHPNIAVLHDAFTHENADVIVMELLEGEPLSQHLENGPLPQDVVLRYSIQIVDALAYAHRQAVVHRDIKPSNIIVTPRGIKLLDFGIAQLSEHADPTGAEVERPTGSGTGGVAGTLFYMSPEQFTGMSVDHRTDIYSFGLLFCQMCTGFNADFDSGIPNRVLISGILEQISSGPMRSMAARCVAPDPSERWLEAADLLYALQAISESAHAVPAHKAGKSNKLASWLALGGATLVSLLSALVWWITPERPPRNRYHFAISPPTGVHLISLELGGPPIISPDGQTLAFVGANSNGETLVWVKQLDAVDATPLVGTVGASHPFWSADSRAIAYFVPGRLMRIQVAGGSPRVLAEAPYGRGGAWSPDGVILFTPNYTEALYRVSAEGGIAEPVTRLNRSNRETSHRWPSFLPDGRRFLFLVRSDRSDVQGLYAGSLESPIVNRIGSIESSAVYAQSEETGNGYLVFNSRGLLAAQRFSASRNTLLDETSFIAQLPPPDEDTSLAPVSASRTGVLVYRGGSVSRQSLLVVDRRGREIERIPAEGQYRNPRLSPDGQRLAIEKLKLRTGLADVWLFDLQRNLRYRFGLPSESTYSPIWSPDGKTMVFVSYQGTTWDLMRREITEESDVSGVSLVLRANTPQAATDWSRDGKWIIFQEQGSGTPIQWDIGALEVSSSTVQKLLFSEKNERQGQLSPNAEWLAYTSDESGNDRVYIRRFLSKTPRFLVSGPGGTQPKWSPDGRELFYLGEKQEMMSAKLDLTSESPLRGGSTMLFQAQVAAAPGLFSLANYDVDSGGRFIIAAPHTVEDLHQEMHIAINRIGQPEP